MSIFNDFPPVGDEAWTHDVPSLEPCRLFLMENNRNPDKLWLLAENGETSDNLALFARALTLDLQQEMPGKVQEKLDLLAGVQGSGFRMSFPPTGENRMMSGQVSAIAKLIQLRGGYLLTETPDARSNISGDVWSVDVLNPYSQLVFTINISEPVVDGRKRPSSVWLHGDYPEILDGLCCLLSADMQHSDLSRLSVKIKSILDLNNQSGDKQVEPVLNSLSAYLALLVLNRFVHHYYMDKQANVLPFSNVVQFSNNNSNNERYFMGTAEMF